MKGRTDDIRPGPAPAGTRAAAVDFPAPAGRRRPADMVPLRLSLARWRLLHAPVMDGAKLAGIITRHDFLKLIAAGG